VFPACGRESGSGREDSNLFDMRVAQQNRQLWLPDRKER